MRFAREGMVATAIPAVAAVVLGALSLAPFVLIMTALLVWWVVIKGSYKSVEKVFLAACVTASPAFSPSMTCNP